MSLNPRIRLMSLLKMFQASCPPLLHYIMLLCQNLSSFPPPACPNMVLHINNALSLPIFRLYCLLGMPYLLCSLWGPITQVQSRRPFQTIAVPSLSSTHNKLYLPLVESLLYFINSKTHSLPLHFFEKRKHLITDGMPSLISSISSFLVVCKVIVSLTITGTTSLMK